MERSGEVKKKHQKNRLFVTFPFAAIAETHYIQKSDQPSSGRSGRSGGVLVYPRAWTDRE